MRRALPPLPRRSREAGEVTTPRPLAIPDFLCSCQCLRTSSVLCCPTPPSAAVGVFDCVVNGQTSPPVWMPTRRRSVVGDGYARPARIERGAAVARDVRNQPEPFGGEPADGQWGRLVEGPPCGLDGGHAGQATAALGAAPTPPSGHAGSPKGGPGSRRTAQPSTSPPAPRETRRGRGSYPTGRWWGADPGDTGIGTPSPPW